MLDKNAILGIVFGSIFGILFTLACILSARKAIRERRDIKARNAERRNLKRNMTFHHEISDSQLQTDSSVRNGDDGVTKREPSLENIDKIESSNSFIQNDVNKRDPCDTKTVDVEIRSFSSIENNKNSSKIDASGNAANGQQKTAAYRDMDKRNRNKAWEQPQDARYRFRGSVASSADYIEMETPAKIAVNGKQSNQQDAYKDITYFGVRSTTNQGKNLNNGMYRYVNDKNGITRNQIYNNAAFE